MPALNSNTGLGRSITNPVGSPLWNLRKELGIAQTPFGEISGDMISPKMWEARTGRKIKDLAMELGVFNEPGFAQPRSKTFRPSEFKKRPSMFEKPADGDVDASVKYKKYAGPSKYTGPSPVLQPGLL